MSDHHLRLKSLIKTVTSVPYDRFAVLEIISRKLSLPGEEGIRWETHLRECLKTRPRRKRAAAVRKTKIPLEGPVLISGDAELILDPTDGQNVFAVSQHLFSGYLDPTLGREVRGAVCVQTDRTPVQVYQLPEKKDIEEIFLDLGTKEKHLSLTENQIIVFVNKFGGWLCPEGHPTFFLCQAPGGYMVVSVSRTEGRLCAHKHKYRRGVIDDPTDKMRAVIPRIDS